jgi:rhamnulokinase
MSRSAHYLAIDLGSSSGRVILGSLTDDRLVLSEIHRFANGPVCLPDGLHWDVLRLWDEVKQGITITAGKHPEGITSIGVDSWGVDYALLDPMGVLIGNPYHYRDSQTNGMMDKVFQRVPREEIFAQTGIQFLQINTLYQLFSMVSNHPQMLLSARTFLMIPDLFNYWLTGQMACELTDSTTTQFYNPVNRNWAYSLLERMNIPTAIFPEVVPPGTVLGRILPELARETGAGEVPVITTPSHDTAAAVAAVPGLEPHFAWISSGTWSIMGAEVAAPVINAQALACNLTNEGGVAGTWRLCKNIMGLWLVQECKRTWAAQGEELTYDAITHSATQAKPFQAVIDPDSAEFLVPGNMPERIRAYCQRTGQSVPQTKGEIVRCALESIALKYRWVLEKLEALLGYRLEPLYIVGGGSKNILLNQLVANATERVIMIGPAEATATGNIMMQAIALGQFANIYEARDVVRRSFAMQTYEPTDRSSWKEAYGRLLEMKEKYA